jgi:hypothetical protein
MTAEQSLERGQPLTRARRRQLLLRVLVRSLLGVAILLWLYYVLPLQDLRGVPVARSLLVGLAVLVVAITVQVFGIAHSRHPALRAVEALALSVPFFLLMFASTYVVMAQDSAANFSSHQLSRTDSLYFTMTIFSTVGFGDITATSHSARVLVTVQMVLDLVILGLGVQAFRGAVSVGRQRSGPGGGPAPGTDPGEQTKGTDP